MDAEAERGAGRERERWRGGCCGGVVSFVREPGRWMDEWGRLCM